MSKHPIGYALSAMNSIASSTWVDKLGLRKPIEKLTYQGTKSGFQAIAASTRQFKSVTRLMQPARLEAPAQAKDLFDLNITEEQQMMRDSVRRFAEDVIRPAAHDADNAAKTPEDVLEQVAELGLNYFAVPEDLGGAATERSPVTSMLIAEDLAYGDMGIAVSILSSIGVANALTHWGTAQQQSKYLPAFLDEKAMPAAMAINEPTPLFDPNKLTTTAKNIGTGYILQGKKSMVPLIETAELFLVAANLESRGPALFIVESSTEGVSIQTDPSMGLKPAGIGQLNLNNVKVPNEALLGEAGFDYQAFLNYGRLAWCAMACGTAEAVLNYCITYCNERIAFGEPISHRQSVAFIVADMGIELESMRVLVQRAVSRAERGMSFQREAYLASILCAEKAMEIGTNGVQLLGGHGFTKEHPVERWYRDLRSIAVIEGGLHL